MVTTAHVDGLRALAALYVVVQHTFFAVYWTTPAPAALGWMRYGNYAVTAFIVISGYSLAVAVARGGGSRRRSYRTLLPDRLRRLLPAYLFALAVAVGLHAVLPLSPSPTAYDTGASQSWSSVLTQALLLQDVHEVPLANYAFWSIAIEVHVYLLLPVVLWLWRFRPLPWVVLLFLVGGWALVAMPFGDRLFFDYYGLFVLGVGVAVGCLGPARPAWVSRVPWSVVGLLLVGAVVVVNSSVSYAQVVSLQPLTHGLVGLATACFLAGGASVLSLPWLRALGVISFSVYLLHAPVVELLRRLLFSGLDPSAGAAGLLLLQVLTLVVVLPVAALSYRWLERPFLSSAARRRSTSVAPAGA